MSKNTGAIQTAAWVPEPEITATANISLFMKQRHFNHVSDFHRWTVDDYPSFWQEMLKTLSIVFKQPPTSICNLSDGIESPKWLADAKMNIVDSCFTAPSTAIALIYETDHTLKTITYGELEQRTNLIANSLVNAGFKAGDAIAVCLPMHHESIAIYLGIIKMGGVVVSIADSFTSHEIATRLTIANAKAIFTQDQMLRGNKQHPLYEKVIAANAPTAIVLTEQSIQLRSNDLIFDEFLCDNADFDSAACDPMSPCNILFSSGTTAAPKAIMWTHCTAIKAASDAYFHQNIQPNDRLTWPTNLGWMMGPWLIYAALINQAAIALYTDLPKDRAFGEFVSRAGVTMLGVVPTLVASWRESRCMEQLDWQNIKVFSSTGECSNPDDMRYLMALAGGKPVIEYCGGTEIGGAYVSSTVIEPNYPSQFTTPVMGIDFILLNENGQPADFGEVAIIPPSIGLSTILLNADHHRIYYADMPTSPDGKVLRRHGDQLMRLENGNYMVYGRVDDSMNLGGIKVSAAEIERAAAGIDHIQELAAVAVSPPNNGPSRLIIYAVTSLPLDKADTLKLLQKKINTQLNPLFKIHDLVFIDELPKTASNKIMRRVLRDHY